jgi:hypothetical protein
MCRTAGEVWTASHHERVGGIDAGRVNAYQHLIILDHRLVYLLEF